MPPASGKLDEVAGDQPLHDDVEPRLVGGQGGREICDRRADDRAERAKRVAAAIAANMQKSLLATAV